MKSAGAARRLVTGPRPAMVARPAAAAAKQLGVARPADGYVARATDTSIAPPRLGGDDHAPGAEPIDAVRQRELVRRLGMLARSLGKDFKLRLEPGSWWAYHFDANKITYPIADMMAHDDEYNLGVICHELSHRLYSRLPPTSRSDNKSFHFLWNAIEDIRINKIISTRYAGVEGYMKELYRDFAAPEKLDKPLPRAMQFGFAFIHEWATGSGERSPFASDPDVIAAMEAAQPYIDEATRLPPGVDLRFSDLTKEEADAEALHSFEVLRSRVWPIYQQLLEQDLADPATRDAAQELNEQQKQEEGAEGAQGAGESGEAGDPEETDGAQGAGGAGETGESEETDGAQGAGGAGETGESEETDGAQGAGGAGETGESEETDGAQGAGGAGETGESEETDGAQGAGGAGETGESEETDGAQGAGGAGETGESGETDGEPGAGGAARTPRQEQAPRTPSRARRPAASPRATAATRPPSPTALKRTRRSLKAARSIPPRCRTTR
ncbi:MAG: hypothetical protein IPJ65_19080 [Archangiaceae bacterium]|nr:hypothetical protein [Archangiaceae bacterium]